ncbi:helix-turn-helix transcriptional regulator [Labilibaculum sp. K2S]|uniref:helix-turn-helix domain-containing protein n=1 Tax=Labilibaculum sp. K2S TaxID=3056386 RepID=UPI0025A4320B|nr:helix-turn-helix transcriptional regulator [Labilibaculum sp. K2S]MDM8160216.1 helix-turn-helix transcriptional regulator [Labilibaculum sp. K2S]
MVNTNKNWVSMSDKAIISAIGGYVKEQRLLQNKTQAKIAETAGVNRWTVSQLEKGEAVSLISLLQILRALDLLHVLDNFKIETQLSPLELAKLDKQKRQRARGKDDNKQNESEW